MRPNTRKAQVWFMLGAVALCASCAAAPRAKVTEAPRPEHWQVKAMVPGRFEQETTGEVWGTKVAYLDKNQAAPFRLTVKNGLFYDASGAIFSSTDRDGAIFVMDEDGVLYASNQREPGEFHHSSLVNGGPVAAAGEVIIKEGKLTWITDKSGHYEPEHLYTAQFLCELLAHGVDLTDVPLVLVTVGKTTAKAFLSGYDCAKLYPQHSK